MAFFREKPATIATAEDFEQLDPPRPPGGEPENSELPVDTRQWVKKDPRETWATDEKAFKQWVTVSRGHTVEALDDHVANETYAAALWVFRAAALKGDYPATRSMEIWLNWAGKKLRERKNPPKPVNNPNQANFGSRAPEGE
jgi:hypothetical protein